jgi:hypothetical protein
MRRILLIAAPLLFLPPRFLLGQASPIPDQHWPLRANTSSALPDKSSFQNFDVVFNQNGARFDGMKAQLKLADSGDNVFPDDDFTILLWIQADADHADGDILSFIAPAQPPGFHIGITSRTGSTHSQAADRQLVLCLGGAPSHETWTDIGRPGQAVYIHSMTVHDQRLHVGTCEPGPGQKGHVYSWDDAGGWRDHGSPDPANAVISMAPFNNRLYVGVGKYRLAGSALAESTNENRGAKIYRESRGESDSWEKVGELPGADAVGGLCVFRDHLLASSLYKPALLARMNAEEQWESLPLPDGDKRVESMTVFHDQLFATSYDNAHVYRFDGAIWTDTGPVGENTQCYAFSNYWGKLHVSTWPSGRVYRYEADNHWTDVGRLGEELEVMGMTVYHGCLYAGTLPLAQVYRYDGRAWDLSARVDLTPDVKYRRAWTMAVHHGRLFVGTLPSGHVHALDAGHVATHPDPFPTSQTALPLAIVRHGDRVTMRVGNALPVEIIGSPQLVGDLHLGFGPHGHFRGSIRDLFLFARALDPAEIDAVIRAVGPPK